tara:strand:+ start:786 stop:1838 length:1053 start_codon:yes stop_codon:yes gene_type:complete
MKLVSIVGARPQFIKLASLSNKIRTSYEEIIIHTGQHFDKNMSRIFFDELNIPKPDINLGIAGGSHGEQTGKMIICLEKEIKKINPSFVIVFGDTNSTLAAAIAAAKITVPIIHIEAGLRSYNRTMPEEINRIITDHASDYLFAPTTTAMKNLSMEGLKKKSFLTGDLMVDTLLNNVKKAKQSKIMYQLKLDETPYYLLTLHRPYNVDKPLKLKLILDKIHQLNFPVIFSAHPRTQDIITKNNITINSNIRMIDPLSYLDFLCLQLNAEKIVTDSGGIQKEAYILNKVCITLRSETEWIETISNGWNTLLDPSQNDFINIIESFEPSKQKLDIFGKDVARKMFKLIKKLN